MKLLVPLISALFVAGCYASSDKKMDAMNMSHVHMGHVSTQWGDTPDKAGLLTTAMNEAKIAAQHAGFALKKPTDLGWMKMHVGHVMHAVDPGSVAKGPGLGYGVIKAAQGAAKHVDFAANSEGASGNVKTHAQHVATTAMNAVDTAKEIMRLSRQVQESDSAGQAAKLVEQIVQLTDRLNEGVDANGDGNITWHKGEGGLNEAAKHMGFMFKGEGLPAPGA